ncbi:hypothetical protein OG339_22330 [Streptosporangium sp. NBC_01495]|uniref:D-alanine--D-alanine ligase family protein n=1 Tax=Streptosporangium sp. NBC_01495 TaxID=2903899 RepID=UPI002E30D0D4|nr:hypothetical protein [Streptosporangium sp. NBC_01495]
MTFLIAPDDSAAIEREIRALRVWHHSRGPLNVALVYGGVSAEDRLYLAKSAVEQMSVTALSETLSDLGATFKILDPCDPAFVRSLLDYEVVLSNLHGPFGEDGRLQGLLDYLRMPYSGSSVAASAIAANKILCKQTMGGLNLLTPPWWTWRPGTEVHWTGRPMMVKPALGGSSVGMNLVRTDADLVPALREAWAVDPSPVLVEEYIEGTPVTVGVLELPMGLLVFPPLATEVNDGWYDADTKLTETTDTVSVAPAEFPAPVLDALTRRSRTLWDGLGCRGAARIDFIVTDSGQVHALEVNTTPGMSRKSNYALGAARCGLTHADVVLAWLHNALTRPPYDVPLPIPVLDARDTAA